MPCQGGCLDHTTLAIALPPHQIECCFSYEARPIACSNGAQQTQLSNIKAFAI